MKGIKILAPILLSMISVTAWATEEYTNRIINGEEAGHGAWPSTVALLTNEDNTLFMRQFCAGNIIAQRWVLTAAHCLFDEKSGGAMVVKTPEQLSVAMGVTDLRDEHLANEIAIKAFEVHPFYDPYEQAGYFDIALLELEQDASESAMELFVGDLQQHSGSAAMVVGWGVTAYPHPTAGDYPNVLNQLMVPLVSREVCNLPASYNGILIEGQFCAGYQAGAADSCIGDSGGPIMMYQGGAYRQIGVVSFGDGCAQADKYGVYADVPYFASWIRQYLDGTLQAANGAGGNTPPGQSGRDTGSAGSGGGALAYLLLLLLPALARRRRDCSA